MRRTRRSKRLASSSSDENDGDSVQSTTKTPPPPKHKKTSKKIDGSSSSESDIENYLQPIDKIDFNSSFFNPQQKQQESFENIEKKIFNNISRLTDSSSDDDDNKEDKTEPKDDNALATTSKLNFQQLQEYTKKMEDAKQHIAQYNAKREQSKSDNTDIFNMLKNNELKTEDIEKIDDFHSSDFESCSDSEKEGWETVKNQDNEKIDRPKGVQITIEMPNAIKKKKKNVDFVAAMKRRLNRIRKENQVFIHKVHLLCWIAHGNYVNGVINNEKILACALSLLPSEKCYPADRTDLNYLEQIVRWFKKAVEITDKIAPKNQSLIQLLEKQIELKQCYNKKMFVYIFIAILRALGIQSRLVLSFRVEPLRPPASELCSLSTKTTDKKATKTDKAEHNEKSTETTKKIDKTGPVKKSRAKQSEKSVENAKTVQMKKPSGKPNVVENQPQKLKGKIEKNLNFVTETQIKDSKKTTDRRSTGKKDENSQEKIPRGKKTGDNQQAKSKTANKRPQRKTSEREILTNNERPKTRSKSVPDETTVAKNKSKQNQSKTKLTPINQKVKNLRSRNNNNIVISQVDGVFDTDSDDERLDGANNQGRVDLKKLRQPKKLPKYKDTDSEDDFVPPTKSQKSPLKSKYFEPTSAAKDVVKLVKNRIKEQRQIDKNKLAKKRKTIQDEDEDSDYVPEPLQKKQHNSGDEFVPETKVKRRIPVKTNKVLSSDDDNCGKTKKQGNDVWVEIFLENEEKWISCDLITGEIHCVNQLYNRATHPVSYIVAWNNNNTLKDVTKRYCQNFNTITRKLRVDLKWWEATLKAFIGEQTVRDKEENDELERQQLEKPLPTSIAEYKNHPLYVLKRHLLKFEAIYPPDAPTLGFVRNEPVYSRQCVYTLHSREIWLKHARVVKPGEKPYKIVKARPKYDKLSNTMITDQLLEIFGPWQTEDYVPPTAVDGIVPRNAFGNVELFKPCMLPKKTVHLKLPGLNKIARRLDIDCASAITGFDFHSGWSHPVYDGFVVCEEYADQLVAAWEIEQEEQEQKERDKLEKRVYTNWKRLIRGLLIRERLKAKYDFGQPSTSGTGKGKKKKTSRVYSKKKQIHSGSDDSGSN